jgi:hypothetical protein
VRLESENYFALMIGVVFSMNTESDYGVLAADFCWHPRPEFAIKATLSLDR